MGNGASALPVAAGDRIAFGELYDELSDRVFAFCVCLLSDRDEAADATHDAFALALQRIHQLREPDLVHAWMFAIARHVCYRRLERRKRHTVLDPEVDTTVSLDDPDATISSREAADLVWSAAEGLSERDRAVLYLNTHEGLDGADLANALGVARANPYSLLHRAKEQLSLAVGVVLVARAGKRDCPQLATMLQKWDGHLTPLLRKRLARHISGCAACRHTKSKALRLSAFAAAPLVIPKRADALPQRHSLERLQQIAAHHPMANERWQPNGFPPNEHEHKRKRRLIAILFGVLALGLATPLAIATASAGNPTPSTPSKPAESPSTTVAAGVRRTDAPVETATTVVAAPSPSADQHAPTGSIAQVPNREPTPPTSPRAATPATPPPTQPHDEPATTTTAPKTATTTEDTIPG